jgi:hypothetical protein
MEAKRCALRPRARACVVPALVAACVCVTRAPGLPLLLAHKQRSGVGKARVRRQQQVRRTAGRVQRAGLSPRRLTGSAGVLLRHVCRALAPGDGACARCVKRVVSSPFAARALPARVLRRQTRARTAGEAGMCGGASAHAAVAQRARVACAHGRRRSVHACLRCRCGFPARVRGCVLLRACASSAGCARACRSRAARFRQRTRQTMRLAVITRTDGFVRRIPALSQGGRASGRLVRRVCCVTVDARTRRRGRASRRCCEEHSPPAATQTLKPGWRLSRAALRQHDSV